ncbi:MAG: hypothetical protein H0T94_14185 [Acidimicrobiia bacterium]|nr:hypothetical protein [Acidimicrobiia bacterium]MDQ3499497.1 hypothetical protein [Actinomycetota bacterium]
MKRPAFYAPIGTTAGDLVALLHPPYTAWNLSHVAIGAAVAPDLDGLVLAGTLVAFLFGLGIGAHAFDELHSRPLRTTLSRRTLYGLGFGGMLAASVVAVVGMNLISPWVLAWAVAGIALATGYAFEWPHFLHTPLGFALAWGAFPTLVGYWAQTQTVGLGALMVAAAMTLLSLTQRALSTPARRLRRAFDQAELTLQGGSSTETWDQTKVLATWEVPLKLLSGAVIALAIALLLVR